MQEIALGHRLEAVLGGNSGLVGLLGRVLGRSGGGLGAVLGGLGVVLGWSWAGLGAVLGSLGRSWGAGVDLGSEKGAKGEAF